MFGDGDTIKLGDVAITALLTNGHTKGSTTFVTNVVDDGKVYTVVFPNGLSINPGYRVAKDPVVPRDRRSWCRTSTGFGRWKDEPRTANVDEA